MNTRSLALETQAHSPASPHQCPEPPEPPARVQLGMPHLNAGGLSEAWLWRHAGDLHWRQIARQLAAESDQIQDEAGVRLYPTFVAIRAEYSAPLAAVGENQLLDTAVEVMPCGQSCAHGRVAAMVRDPRNGLRPPVRLSLSLLSSFAQRDSSGQLSLAMPAARLAHRWAPRAPTPELGALARAGRRGERHGDPFSGPLLARQGPDLARERHQPSPYTDYNGAGLLYFAAYLSIADTVERTLVHRLGLSPRPTSDWALVSSTVRRDIFYYRNLPLGQSLDLALSAFELVPGGVKTHLRLTRVSDGARMADVVTHKALVSVRPFG